MIRSLWSRLTGRGGQRSNSTDGLNVPIQTSGSRLAKDLRDALRAPAKQPDFVSNHLPSWLEQLRQQSWTEQEIEKVRAYADFFSGANARGYQRVVQHELVRQDYTLFMTACVYCYLADRFTEGAALLDMFQPAEDPTTDWCEYWSFAGYIFFAAGRPIERSLESFDRALELGYFSPLLATNAYPVCFEAGRLEQCQQLQQLIHKNCPDDPEALHALACVELARGYYGEGFRLMEARYRMPDQSRNVKLSLLQMPRWQGQDLSGKRLLVHGEQGFGDVLMMVRYLPLLQATGAKLLLDGRSEAATLLIHNFPYCHFITGDLQSAINEPFDYWTGVMSLPYHFDTTAHSVPATDGYLTAPPEQRAYWQQRLGGKAVSGQLRVGLAWSGNPGHRADKRRSIPFELITPLLHSHPDIQFFPLQTQAPHDRPGNLIDVFEELLTLADTAALIGEMDLVISVDTSAIHLAGALGRPAWLLLPYRYEWRWGLAGEANPWYNSVRVCRQKTHGDWSGLLLDVSDALTEFRQQQG